MNGSKSITSIHPCIIITFLLIFITIKIVNAYSDDKHQEILADLPKAGDLDYYLLGLEKIVDFCIRHKLYVDLNLEFGLFLIDVNIRRILQTKRKSIPAKARFRMEQMLLKNDVVADYFHYMIQKTKDNKDLAQDRTLSILFYNYTTWPRPPDEFNTDLLNQTKIYNPEQLEKIYGKWENYFNNVFDYRKYKPTPKESDGCIEYLARAPSLLLARRSQPNCLTPPQCKQGVKEGSEFGYGLSHRILFMVVARFSRGCTVFSEKEDKYKSDKYCMRCFNEAQYIASNSFQMPDLMFEQIALCGLFGHAQFFSNYWLKTLLRFQTTEGCFSEKMITGEFDINEMKEGVNDEWSLANTDSLIMNGQCNGHFTAVAAASLAHALRYIIETYY